MRVLLVSEMFPPDFDGGQEVNAEKIAVGLRERGHDVVVATSRFRPGYKGPADERPWVRRVFGHGPRKTDRPGLISRVLAIRWYVAELFIHKKNLESTRSLLGEQKFDVAYMFGLSRTGWSLALAPTEARIPILWHQGGNNLEGRLLEKPKLGRIARFFRDLQTGEALMDVSRIAYVSQFLIDDSRKRGFLGTPGRADKLCAIIPRGIEFALREDVDRERSKPKTILMAGRIAFFKGFHIGIEALAKLRDRCPDLDWKLVIVGEADDDDFSGGMPGSVYLENLRSRISELGLGSRVSFVGRKSRSEVLDLITSASVFVSASNCGEAFANTIIECMACGTPIIVSHDGSALEVVEDGVSGFVFEPTDAEALSDHLATVLTDADRARCLANAALQTIRERYTLSRVLDLTEATFERIIREAGATER